MTNFKNKLYHYQETPPAEIWERVSEKLDQPKVVKIDGLRGRTKLLFYATTAAAALVIIFVGSIFFRKKSQEKNLVQNSVVQPSSPSDSVNNNQYLEKIIQNNQQNKTIAALENNVSKKYITIAGPDGQPVKISAKVAKLILWADDEYPPRPVWDNKIDKWQQIMLSNTSSPTSAGLMEIIQTSAGKLE